MHDARMITISRNRWVCALLAVAVLLVYANSFRGAFVFDDEEAIHRNPYVTNPGTLEWLWRTPPASTLGCRPAAQWTFALNYATGGMAVAGYHAVNVAIHLGAAVTLFLLLRLILAETRWGRGDPEGAWMSAVLAALWWAVHPLQTQAVTYICQRQESQASLLYLLAMLAVFRRNQAPSPRWAILAVVCCWLGLATKEIALSIPLAAIALTWLQNGKGATFTRANLRFFASLGAGWLLSAVLMLGGEASMDEAVGRSPHSPLGYLLSQAEIIPHYLRLVFDPRHQVFDYYDWPVPALDAGLIVRASLLAAGLVLGFILLARRNWAALPLLLFYAVLAPSSSFITLHNQAFEHRMYLPLACVLALVVTAGAMTLRGTAWLGKPGRRQAQVAVLGILAVVVAWHAWLTYQRNDMYASAERLWRDTAEKRPRNARAFMNLGEALLQRGAVSEGLEMLEHALAVGYRPGLQSPAHHNLAMVYTDLGRLDKALHHYGRAIEADPGKGSAYVNRAVIHTQQKAYRLAAADQEKAIALLPADGILRLQYAYSLSNLGRYADAAAQLAEARRLGQVPPAAFARQIEAGLRVELKGKAAGDGK